MAGSVFWTPLVKTNYKDSKHTEEKAFPLFRFTYTNPNLDVGRSTFSCFIYHTGITMNIFALLPTKKNAQVSSALQESWKNMKNTTYRILNLVKKHHFTTCS